MPERPDLDHLQPRMNDRLRGQTIIRFTLAAPVVLRNLTGGDPRTLLPGLVIQSLTRHRASLLFDLGPLLLFVNPMLAGRFSLGAPTEKAPRDLAFALDLADGAQIRFVDSESMSKVTLLTPDQRAAVPDLGPAGLDLRAPAFTPEALRTLLKGRREQLKTFLLDKTALDCLGNAYADEVLFAAGLHPKTRAGSLDPKAVAALHAGITATLDAAVDGCDRLNRLWFVPPRLGAVLSKARAGEEGLSGGFDLLAGVPQPFPMADPFQAGLVLQESGSGGEPWWDTRGFGYPGGNGFFVHAGGAGCRAGAVQTGEARAIRRPRSVFK
jgi:formamidopyrimidine-DNA glycosylase